MVTPELSSDEESYHPDTNFEFSYGGGESFITPSRFEGGPETFALSGAPVEAPLVPSGSDLAQMIVAASVGQPKLFKMG